MTEAASASSECVLVVDDESDIRESVRELVELIGCKALLAADGREALAVMKRHRPCLVILDLSMPGMSGLEMLEELKREPQLSSVPVIISTSSPQRAPPGFRVVAKPIDIDMLCRCIEQSCTCKRKPLSS